MIVLDKINIEFLKKSFSDRVRSIESFLISKYIFFFLFQGLIKSFKYFGIFGFFLRLIVIFFVLCLIFEVINKYVIDIYFLVLRVDEVFVENDFDIWIDNLLNDFDFCLR